MSTLPDVYNCTRPIVIGLAAWAALITVAGMAKGIAALAFPLFDRVGRIFQSHKARSKR